MRMYIVSVFLNIKLEFRLEIGNGINWNGMIATWQWLGVLVTNHDL